MLPIFKNLQTFIIYNHTKKSGFRPSINLDLLLIDDFIKTIIIIKNTSTLTRSVKKIIIIKPITSIDTFIHEQQTNLEKIGWKPIKKPYKDKRWGECRSSLYIYPL